MKKHKGDMDGAVAKTIAEEILKGGAPAAAPKEAKKEKKEAPAAKKEENKEKKVEAPAPKAADAAPVAGGEERMVWRQGFYVDNVWQRGRYEVLHAFLS